MARKAKNLNKWRRQQKEDAVLVLNYKRFVLSVLCCGLNPRQAILFTLMNNIKPPMVTRYFDIQREFYQPILCLAIANVLHHRNLMERNSVLSFDGSWAHKRNAKQCIVTFIDQKRKKIVDFQLMRKKIRGWDSTFTGASNLMESHGLLKMIERWQCDDKVVGYVHDNDGKCKALMDLHTNYEEELDANHFVKYFENKFDKVNHEYLGRLLPFKESLIRFMKFLQKSDYTDDQRISFWMNSVYHFKGDHSHCPDPNHSSSLHEEIDDTVTEGLTKLLLLTKKFVTIHSIIST